MAVVFKNNASTTLNGSIDGSTTTVVVTDGSIFPQVTAKSSITSPGTSPEITAQNQKVLIHADVANGSSTFTDIGGHTITNVSNYYTGSTTYYKFGTAGARNTTASVAPVISLYHNDFMVGTGDFTLEGFHRAESGSAMSILHIASASNVYMDLHFYSASWLRLALSSTGGSTTYNTSGYYPTQNTWYYHAIERYNGGIYVYADNTRVINIPSPGAPNPNFSSTTYVNFGGSKSLGYGTSSFLGTMDELSFSTYAKYQGAASITAPTSAYNTLGDPTQYSSTNSTDAGDYFYATISDGTNTEVVKVTNISSNTLTVTRAQEGTSGTAFASGSYIQIRPTNQGLVDLRNDQLYREVAYSHNKYLGA